MDEITERIAKIEARNKRVDADKRWETSWVRRASIAVLTYGVICLFLRAIGESHILLKALVPMLGFVLSTLSLRIIKNVVGY